MGDISSRFNRSEFACKCGCGFDTVDVMLVNHLEWLADYFMSKAPATASRVMVLINSGNRCPTHNKNEGGAKHSPHLKSIAADFRMFYVFSDGSREQIHPDIVAEELEKKFEGKYGIGKYNGRTHFDVRSNGPARWDNRG